MSWFLPFKGKYGFLVNSMHITQQKEGEQSVFSLVYETTNCVIARAKNKSKWNIPVTDTTPPPPPKKKKKKKKRKANKRRIYCLYWIMTGLPLHTSGVSDQRGGCWWFAVNLTLHSLLIQLLYRHAFINPVEFGFDMNTSNSFKK